MAQGAEQVLVPETPLAAAEPSQRLSGDGLHTRTPPRERQAAHEPAATPAPSPLPYAAAQPAEAAPPVEPIPPAQGDTAQATAQGTAQPDRPQDEMDVDDAQGENEKGEMEDDEKKAYSDRRTRAKSKVDKKVRRKKVSVEVDEDRLETPKRPNPEEAEKEDEDDDADSQNEWGRKEVKRLQKTVRKKAGEVNERVSQVEDLLTATRQEAERQAMARMALQQRAGEAQRDDLMRALAVWGLPREAKFPDQASWWESAIEGAVREVAAEPRDVMGVDISSIPPRVLFRTAGARNRCYDRYVTQSKGLKGADKGAGKKGKSGGMQLEGGPRVWLAYIETKTDEDKKALLRACTNLVRECIGTDAQTLWAHHVVADRHSGKILVQLQWEDKDALAIVRADDRIFEKVRTEVAVELQGLRPLRDFGWEIRVQQCDFKISLDEFMDQVRVQRGEYGKGKGKSYGKYGKYGKAGKGYEEDENGTGNGTASTSAAGYGRAPGGDAWGSWRPTPPTDTSENFYVDKGHRQEKPYYGKDDWLKPPGM